MSTEAAQSDNKRASLLDELYNDMSSSDDEEQATKDAPLEMPNKTEEVAAT